MQIQIDSREKSRATIKILDTFKEQNIRYYVSKMIVGDYVNLNNTKLVIDRKQHLGELSSNLFGKDKARFLREIKLANELGIRLIVLCEHNNRFKTLEDIKNYKNPHSKVKGIDLMNEMHKLKISYDIDIVFCSKEETGLRIIEILKRKE